MRSSIRYASNGARRYFLEDREVSEAEYESSVTPGRLSDMLAARRAPRGRSDCVFLGAMKPGGEQFNKTPGVGKMVMERARRLGQSTSGVYLHGPGVWVNSMDEAKRVCEQFDYRCEGLIDYAPKMEPVPDDKPYRLDETLVRMEMANRLGGADPRDVNLADLEETVRQECTPTFEDVLQKQAEAELTQGLVEALR